MSETILLVEGHDARRRSLRLWLEAEFSHCRIIEAASGEEAVAVVQISSPCVVVMPIELPGVDGLVATRRIKATVPSLRVVLLSIHEDEEHRAAAAKAGASAYVCQQKMLAELIPTLAALLSYRERGRRDSERKTQNARQETLTGGGAGAERRPDEPVEGRMNSRSQSKPAL